MDFCKFSNNGKEYMNENKKGKTKWEKWNVFVTWVFIAWIIFKIIQKTI